MSGRNDKTKYQTGTIMMRIAAIMVCLCLLSIWMVVGLLARYINSDEDTDKSRVALFDVAATKMSEDLILDVSDTVVPDAGAYTVMVENNSEVAVSYDVILELDVALPDYMKVTLDEMTEPTKSADGKVLTFSKVGNLAVDAEAKTHTIQFVVSDVMQFMEGATGEEHKVDFSMQTKVRFVQVD